MEAIVGSLIGAAATLLAVLATIIWTKKRRKKDYTKIIKNSWKSGLGFNRCFQIIDSGNINLNKMGSSLRLTLALAQN